MMRRLRVCVVLSGWLIFPGLGAVALVAQVNGNSNVGTPIAPSTTPDSVYGQVISASTGLPVPRALVRMNTRAVLTDHEGKFRFSQNTDSSANILVTKPGFFFTTEYGDPGNVFFQGAQLRASLELRLYPEALLTGTVLAPDGTPLPRILVTASREVFDDGGRRWIVTGQATSDSHGNFRLPVEAGVYRLETRYVPRDSTTGETILPVTVPSDGLSNTSQAIQVHSGEEQHFELRPGVGPAHVVTVRTQGSLSGRGSVRITARMGNGSQIQANSLPDGEPGETKVELPQGTYTLVARTNTLNGEEEAEAMVTVPDHDISGVTMQFSPVPSIPVELVVDEGATSDNSTVNLTQLGLTLRSDQPDAQRGDGSVGLMQLADRTFAFTAPTGDYRVQARGGGSWYVKSINYGDSDLLQQELVVAPGVSGTPMRVTVSNQTGSLQGTVSLNGEAAACWVYLVPTGPSAQIVMSTRSNAEGSYSFASLPPGSYEAIAFERRHVANYRDAESLTPFRSRVESVSVNAGDKPMLNLDAVPVSEMAP